MRYVLAILAGSLLWGLAWMPIQGLAAQGLTPLAITLASYGPAALLLLPASLRRRRLWWVRRRVFAAIAGTGATANLCFVAAMATGEAGHQILLYYLSTGWAIVGGRLFLRESLDFRHWASVLLAFGGAWTVLDGPAARTVTVTLPELLAILAGVAQASTNLLFRLADDVPVVDKNLAMFGGTAAVGVMVFTLGLARVPEVGASTWLAAVLFGLAWLTVADGLIQYGVSHLPATRSAVLNLSELPITVLSAAVLVGDQLSTAELGGGAMIVSAALNELFRRHSLSVIPMTARDGA